MSPQAEPTPDSDATAIPTAAATAISATSSPSSGPTLPVVDPYLLPPDPLFVDVHVDEERAVTGLLSAEVGLELVATAADGTRMTLTVPPHAVADDQEIRMTPVTEIDGIELDRGLTAAAQFEPDGLTLYQPATLLIEPADSIPPDEEVTFAFQDGEAFAYPVDVESPAIKLYLFHFSGAGVGRASRRNETPLEKRPPSKAYSQFHQKVAALNAARRHGQLIGQESSAEEDARVVQLIHEELKRFYDSDIGPRLDQAKSDCDVAEEVIPTAVSWARSLGVPFGYPEGGGAFAAEVTRIFDAWQAAIVNCYNEDYEYCKGERDPEVAPVMTSRLRELALNGLSLDGIETQRIIDCLTFEVRFESLILQDAPTFDAEFYLKGTATIQARIEGRGSWSGSGDLEYVRFNVTGQADCPGEYSPGSGSSITVLPNETARGQPPKTPMVQTITFIFNPGVPTESVTMLCPGTQPIPVTLTGWLDIFKKMHPNELVSTGFILEGFERVGTQIYARKSYQQTGSNEGSTFNEQTTFDLVHTPR